jgi:hypothetical protein
MDGEGDGVEGPLEEEQEAVRLVDLLAVVLFQEVPRQPVVAREDLRRPPVTQGLDEACRVDQIGEHQCPDGGPTARLDSPVALDSRFLLKSGARAGGKVVECCLGLGLAPNLQIQGDAAQLRLDQMGVGGPGGRVLGQQLHGQDVQGRRHVAP